MRAKKTAAEHAIAAIASGQQGNVTRKQLTALGLRPAAITRRIAKGLLIPQHRGVYRVGHAAPSTEATYMAAVLAAGGGSAVSGRAAGHLMRVLKGAPPPPEVIAPTKKRIKGLATREAKIDPRDVIKHKGIPCTTAARTLVDLAAELPESALAKAVHEAIVIHRLEPEDVEAVLARIPNAKGARTLRRILRGDARITLSKLESRFLEVLEQHRLPLPDTNTRVGGRYVDCRWPERKLTVELDSYRYHASRHAWEQDRRREREARARGDDFRRYTWDDVTSRVRGLIRELTPVLAD